MNEFSIDRRKTTFERRELNLGFTRSKSASTQRQAYLRNNQSSSLSFTSQKEESNQAARLLKESCEHYRDLFENAPIAYFLLEADGAITEVNICGAALLGIDRHQLISHNFNDYVTEDCRESLRFYLAQSDRKCEQQSFDLRIKRKSVAMRHVHAEMWQIKNNNRSAWRLILSDITANKHLENTLRSLTQYLDNMIEYADGPILVWDASGRISRANKATQHLVNQNAKQLIGQDVSTFLSSLILSGMEKSQGLQASDIPQRFEMHFPQLSGLTKTIAWKCTNLYDPEDQKLLAVIAQGWDITEYATDKQLQEACISQLELDVSQAAQESLRLKEACEEAEAALKVLLKMRETEEAEAKNSLMLQVKQEVLPFLYKLQNGNRNVKQLQILGTLEANLQRLISAYGHVEYADNHLKKLTPKEIEVATMVREGFSTKTIAKTLSLAASTICVHRKNIRKKLGLKDRNSNLRSYLITY